MTMDEIKLIKGHLVTFLKFPSYSNGHKFYYCAYVYLPKIKSNSKRFDEETFRHRKTIGIDTGNHYNFEMPEKQLKEDATRQIKEIIKEYEQRQENVK